MEMVFAGGEAYNILPLHYVFRTDGTLNDLVLLLLGGMWRGVEVRCSGTWLGVEVVLSEMATRRDGEAVSWLLCGKGCVRPARGLR